MDQIKRELIRLLLLSVGLKSIEIYRHAKKEISSN